MAKEGVVAICRFGGNLALDDNGNWSYTGGEAHVVDISREMLLDDLKAEIADMFNIDPSNLSIKYMLPSNKNTLITISRDKDVMHMVDLNIGSVTTDIYISNVVENRETMTPVADSGTSIIDNAAEKIDSRIPPALSVTPVTPIMDASNNFELMDASNNFELMDVSNNFELVDASDNVDLIIDASNNVNFLSLVATNNNEPCSSRSLWGGLITDVGQEFDSVKMFRLDLCKYAHARGFRYKYVKNDHDRVTVQCEAENCPWRLHASGSSRNQNFTIKKFNNVHTCGAGTGEHAQLKVTRLWLGEFLKEKLLDNPQYKPKDIIRDVYQVHGINLNYTQAWHAREGALKELRLLHEEIFCHLPWLRDKILETNPGSVVRLAASPDSKIRRFFVAFQASLQGFRDGCHPLLFLEKIYLKASDTWKLLCAASVDGNDEVFPIAFAAVESETPDSWHWFLLQLRDAIPESEGITVVSSRRMNLDESVPLVFEGTRHSYSLTHLIDEFKAEFKSSSWSEQTKQGVVAHIKDAAQAYTVEEFDACIEKIKSASEEAAEWVLSTKPENWSNAHFGLVRYDHFSSSIVESLNKWITTKDGSSAVQMFEAVRVRLTEVIDSRRRSCGSWAAEISPSSEVKLQKILSKARPQTVVCSSDTVFEVRGDMIDVVDIGKWECTCRRWQLTGLPCVHASAVITRTSGSVYDFCAGFFKRESYLSTYSGSINPLPGIETLDSILPLYPPRTKRAGGRRKRIRIDPNKTSIRSLHCSRCKSAGHNKATCEA